MFDLNDAQRFIAKLVSEQNSQFAKFTVVETNTFKHITHLSLNFVPGSDGTVKKYLSDLVKRFKVTCFQVSL
jgi:spindle assembly abnormal protein 6